MKTDSKIITDDSAAYSDATSKQKYNNMPLCTYWTYGYQSQTD